LDDAIVRQGRLVRLYEVMRHLRVIAEVADTGQVIRAARAAQSALWPAIQELGGTPTTFLVWLDQQKILR